MLGVFDDGATVIADLRGATVRPRLYSAVRALPPVHVPSLGGEIRPEKWVATVELKRAS